MAVASAREEVINSISRIIHFLAKKLNPFVLAFANLFV
jgi:hypothetical protein